MDLALGWKQAVINVLARLVVKIKVSFSCWG